MALMLVGFTSAHRLTHLGGTLEPAMGNLFLALVIYGIPILAILVGIGALLSIAKSLRTLVHAHKLGPEPIGPKREGIFEDEQ